MTMAIVVYVSAVFHFPHTNGELALMLMLMFWIIKELHGFGSI